MKNLALDLEIVPQTPWQGGASGAFPTVGSFVSLLYNNILTIAGVILFLMIVSGGFMYIQGGSESDPKKAAQGKDVITVAVGGFLIIFAAYWILQIIKVVTGVDIINPGF